ncbi:branched chain amino acid ABC transporter substrate-binding protein [Gemmata obscuriglobus]|uniref:Branched chain amino acid ABC transporter substrate-binding protein n=2 Tax=Gemmata obscuriglobus TaxID=114 RepID=A0A2Z3H416_9BACT|nr:branched chain amino acid ABC transporter substrate-binding protein [Gemmata obscuriglobus]
MENRAAGPNMNRRKFLGAAAAAAVPALVTGCGGGGSTDDGKGGGGGGGAAPGTPGVIRIVSSLPRTGSAKGQTNTIVNGIQMAIEDYGGKGGDFKIEYSDWDDATAASGSWDGPTEKANAQKAVADPDVMAYIGPYNSNAAKVSMPELNEAGLLQVSPAVTWPGLTKKIKGVAPDEPEKYRPAKKKNFCRVCTTDDLQGPLAADFAAEVLKAKRVYILNDKELYGEGLAKLFRQRCEELKLEIVGDEGINTTSIEFGGLMTKIKGLNPDLVYFGGTTQSKGGQVAKDMVGAGLTCPILAPDGCYEQAFIDSAGAANLNGRAYVSIVGLDPSQLTGKGAEFVKRYKEKYKTAPEAFALYGYECAKVVLEAIKKVNKKDREAILKEVLATKNFTAGAVGGAEGWGFDNNGDTTLRQVTISVVENGKFVPKKTVTK